LKKEGPLQQIRVDNGTELTTALFTTWCEQYQITIAYIKSGKPQQNGLVARFNRSFRCEFLNAYLFDNIRQVQVYMDQRALGDIRRKLKILNHAQESRNISATCRYFGITKETFYRWKRGHTKEVEKAFINCKPCP
jgi:transposase InsO family protein